MFTSNILLKVPEPLSIRTVEESEAKTSPGDPLLKEGTPVPEPMMINWSISNSWKKEWFNPNTESRKVKESVRRFPDNTDRLIHRFLDTNAFGLPALFQ
jgi:hypothetical protein